MGLAGTRYSGDRRVSGALGAPRSVGWCWGCYGASRGVGVSGLASGLGAQPHWAPVQGPNTATGSPGGVTYLAKAKQVTEMSSVGYYYIWNFIS